MATIANRLRAIADELEQSLTEPELQQQPAWIDLRDTLPHNSSPDNPDWLSGTDWAIREEKTAITVHHVAAEGTTPQGVANWTTTPYHSGGKGLPRLQYHFWIARNGTIYYCTDLKYGQWHDHCGYPNSHISVVLDGCLNRIPPNTEQITATAKLLVYLMDRYGLSEFKGHCDYFQTACPGWQNWKEQLIIEVEKYQAVPSFTIEEQLSKAEDILG